MSKKTLFALTIAAFMTGCATLPSPEVMRAETQSYSLPRLPEKDKAIVYVVRPSSLGTFIRFNVFLNDQEANSEMGFTRGTQYIYFNVNPGKHKIYSKAENWAETDVDAKSGDIIFIQQEPAMGVIMARNNIFKIDELQGKYNVKTLTPGTILKSEK
jgi:hypothetical protein